MATNFTEAQKLLIDSFVHRDRALVCIRQSSGSMCFQFDMTPQQAREMAAELLGEAVKAEQALQVAA